MAKLKRAINSLFTGTSGHEPDMGLIIAVGIILVFGLIMLSSATSAIAYAEHKDGYFFAKHQLFGLGLGLIAFFILSKIDYHVWRNPKLAFGFLIFSILLLLLVFIPGVSSTHGTARSWINIFGHSLQPSEFVKLSFLLYLSAWLESRGGKRLGKFREGSGPFFMVLGLISFLMIKQPDIGTLSIIVITSLIVYFIGGGNINHILLIVIAGIISLFLLVRTMPYQADRFKCFFDPRYSANDICYQVNQSLIAVGSGGFWGRGLGNSRQKFMYLPEVSGDSIFAIISEETGLIFSGILVLLFAFIFYRGYVIAKYAPDHFGRILAIGIVSWLVVQAMINIGGIINLIPMTGVPLPFISYGGSAILASLAAVGILVNISKQARR